MQDFLDKSNLFVVVGATKNREKYGYRTLMRLKQLGLRVVGVNPKYREIEGVKCVGSLEEVVKGKSDLSDLGQLVVITVVPPEVTKKVVGECGRLGLDKIWMQPGSESEVAVERAKELGIKTVQACIVVDGLGESWGKLG